MEIEKTHQEFPYKVTASTGSSLSFDEGINYVQLKLELLAEKGKQIETVNTSQHILIAIDKSGSMSGSPIDQSKVGIEEMVTFLTNSGIKNITLVPYESSATIIDFHTLTHDQQMKHIKDIRASGGTSFSAAFRRIEESVKAHNSTDVKVVFFTDGEDGSARSALPAFKDFFTKVPNSEFHTVGFRANHDADLLNSITKLGSSNGTFQYVKESAEIKTCVESITGLIGCGGNLKAYLLHGGKESLIEIETAIDDETQKTTLSSNLFLTEAEIGETIVLKIVYGDSEKFVEIKKADLKTPDTSNLTNPILISLNYLKHEVAKLLLEATKLRDDKGNFNKAMYDSIIEQIQLKDKKLDELHEEANKLKIKEKKEFFPMLFDAKELVTEFYSKLKELQSGQLNNDKIAALNSLAYRGVTKKALQKKLDIRTQNNVGVINNVYVKVKETTNALNFNELRSKYDGLAKELGTCVFSANDFIECLKEEDCLCLTYDVGRSQAAIMDPTQIIIKSVFPTQISVSSFLFSAEYALKKDEMAHGGFKKENQGSIVKGMAREDITGVLPLYICKENWPVAKQLMKPALGWTVTLDPLGYAFSQVATVPFLVLAKLYEMQTKQDTEFVKLQIKWVEETCMQIISDASAEGFETKMSEEIIGKFKPYLTDPASRTVDQIASNKVFLVQLHLLIKMGLMQPIEKNQLELFYDALFEEELRRRSQGFGEQTATSITQYLFKVLNVDEEAYINQPFKEFLHSLEDKNKGGASPYATNFIAAAALVNPDMKEVAPAAATTAEKTEATGAAEPTQAAHKEPVAKTEADIIVNLRDKDGKYNETQLSAIQQLNESKDRAWSTLILFKLFGLEKDFENKFEINPENEHFLLCLYLQNRFHSKNADRRDSVANKNYVNPFAGARDYIEKMYRTKATEEKNRKITEAQNEMLGNAFAATAQIFYKTEDLNEAAGTLMGTYIGVNVSYFLKALYAGGAPHFKAKLRMLVWGGYKGVQFYKDDYKQPHAPPMWNICKRKANKVLENNAMLLTKEEWKELLPNLSEINILLKRGEPVPPRAEKEKAPTK